MEIKKSEKENLDNQRGTAFLLGLILALAIVFVALEYISDNNAKEHSLEQTDEMAQEIELMPINQKDLISTLKKPVVKNFSKTLKVIDQPITESNPITKSDNLSSIDEVADINSKKTNTQQENNTPHDENELRIVEQLPEFPGGMSEFIKWLYDHLRYPTLAQQQFIEGKVVVSFLINKDGTIANPKIEKSVDPLLDREALRVVKLMPKWKPGIENNKPCQTMIAIPIVFKL